MSTTLYPRDLSRCPWCQGKAKITALGHRVWSYNITCEPCAVVMFGDTGVTRSDMIWRWNARAIRSQP